MLGPGRYIVSKPKVLTARERTWVVASVGVGGDVMGQRAVFGVLDVFDLDMLVPA
jgi:hypothetical protein